MMRFEVPTWSQVQRYRLSILSGAALLLAILVVSLVWLAPLISANENLEIQARQQEELARKYREKLTQAQSIRDNLVKQEQELKQMQKRLFRGNDPYQLAASLGELLSSKGGQKLDIKTYQVLASKEYGLYQEVHLRFNFMTTVDGLYFFLDRVKNFETALLVHEINVQKVQRAKGPDLVVNVILAALMEKGEKS
ncbi:MAG: hypothetical protein HPY84_10180 [Syntrophobacteraceae bacterium]|nr:hypothetical protein [Syntrophobacteraceae bacterium]